MPEYKMTTAPSTLMKLIGRLTRMLRGPDGLSRGAVKARVVRAGVLVLIACLTGPSSGEEPAQQKVTVDFRWIEPQVIKGVTEDTGHPIVCGGKDWYAHLKPVLTSNDIATARLTHLHIARADQYAVQFT